MLPDGDRMKEKEDEPQMLTVDAVTEGVHFPAGRRIIKWDKWYAWTDFATGGNFIRYTIRMTEEPIPERFGELPEYDPKSAFYIIEGKDASGLECSTYVAPFKTYYIEDYWSNWKGVVKAVQSGDVSLLKSKFPEGR